MLFGGGMVSGAVDATPVVGSPQIDYVGINLHGPLSAQYVGLLSVFAVMEIVGGLLAAVGMIMFLDKRAAGPTWRRLSSIWGAWAIPIACARLLEFLAFGTMGPLGVRQPVVRFALVNGALSATIIVSLSAALMAVLARRKSHPSAA